MCDYATQITWKVTNIMMKHYHDKRLLSRLDGRMTPLILESSLINRLGLNKETSRNLLQTSKNLELGLGISQGPIVIMVTISFIIINRIHISCVPLPFVTIIFFVYHCLYTKIVKTKQTQSRLFLQM